MPSEWFRLGSAGVGSVPAPATSPQERCTTSSTDRRRLEIQITGAVQGVGFRPFVYRLAADLALTGWVGNNVRGVVIDVEGEGSQLARFLRRIRSERPTHSSIHTLRSRRRAPIGYKQFEIRHSEDRGSKRVPVLPDLATCPECHADVFEPQNRRYRYPFTNCTRCGPRFSIIHALPYDRPNTTMKAFELCSACAAEYGDPSDRRFHAQPNACPVCGPRLSVWVVGEDGTWHEAAVDDGALLEAAAAVRGGAVVAVKGLGGFHLVVDATSADAVRHLRVRKRRPAKPFAVMVADLAEASRLCFTDENVSERLVSSEAPIVLLARRDGVEGATIAESVAPGNPTLGVMLPSMPLHHLLLSEVGRPVVATSGNVSDEPICTDTAEAKQKLHGIADVILTHNRPIARHLDDSVVQIVAGAPRLLRRARGYAPSPVRFGAPLPTVLAVGAHLKNTIALSIDDQVFVSQHIGDLQTPEAIAAFERVITDFLTLYDARPLAIAHDRHPDYHSTHWATQAAANGIASGLRRASRTIAVQHHHAHLASCLAENQISGDALGVVWDGAGYGLDGTIWGGEFLLGSAADVRRVAHLRTFLLPGGDMAAREPRRAAFAILREGLGDTALDQTDWAPIAAFSHAERRTIATMLDKGLNSPATTSMGRLFDAVAAIAGLCQRAEFEAQAAMSLQFAVTRPIRDAYPIELWTDRNPVIVDWWPTIEGMLADCRHGVDPAKMAERFHGALVEGLVAVAHHVGQERVALTGGCFQNSVLMEHAANRLHAEGFRVLLHRQVPSNDGGISLGQVAVAAATLDPSTH